MKLETVPERSHQYLVRRVVGLAPPIMRSLEKSRYFGFDRKTIKSAVHYRISIKQNRLRLIGLEAKRINHHFTDADLDLAIQRVHLQEPFI
jgi:hypothetical protein